MKSFLSESLQQNRNRPLLRVVESPGAALVREYTGAQLIEAGEKARGQVIEDEQMAIVGGNHQLALDPNIANIDLLKLDVQGHEHAVLKGAENLIRRGRSDIIYMELNWVTVPGSPCPATESIQLLEEVGYRFASPADCDNWREAGSWLQGLTNVIARNPNARG